MSASQQPLAISPNTNRLAVVYRHKFVVSSEHMEENEGQQGFARDQIRRRDEASPSSGIVQPRQVQRGRLNTGYGHVMPQKSIAAWPFLYVMLHTYGRISLKDQFENRRNQTANFWNLWACNIDCKCQDIYLAGRPVAKLLGTNTANTWDEHEVSAFDWLHHSPEQTHLTSRTETSYK
ncbi:hypothetical protein D6C90_02885 [Aureobasidium pullulans]|uniref:Uncharacterized protein n=1 Tax=Aureobasidium pullulans TaxID=5580 RepID=A0A4S9VE67_AURPU|nr:hypothetical protein D6C90_02885 [Aureobasidium pullulans]